MKGQHLPGLFEHTVEAHILVGVHRFVARRGDQETSDPGLAEEPLHRRFGVDRRVEGQIQHRLYPWIDRQHPLDQPAVVGVGKVDLHLGYRMYTEKQQGVGKNHLIVEAHLRHAAPRQFDLARHIAIVGRFLSPCPWGMRPQTFCHCKPGVPLMNAPRLLPSLKLDAASRTTGSSM